MEPGKPGKRPPGEEGTSARDPRRLPPAAAQIKAGAWPGLGSPYSEAAFGSVDEREGMLKREK